MLINVAICFISRKVWVSGYNLMNKWYSYFWNLNARYKLIQIKSQKNKVAEDKTVGPFHKIALLNL